MAEPAPSPVPGCHRGLSLRPPRNGVPERAQRRRLLRESCSPTPFLYIHTHIYVYKSGELFACLRRVSSDVAILDFFQSKRGSGNQSPTPGECGREGGRAGQGGGCLLLRPGCRGPPGAKAERARGSAAGGLGGWVPSRAQVGSGQGPPDSIGAACCRALGSQAEGGFETPPTHTHTAAPTGMGQRQIS